MGLQYSPSDDEILASLADYRALCIQHLATVLGRNLHALRRRLRLLQGEGLVEAGPRGLRGGRGRPEQVLSLTSAGVEQLRRAGRVRDDISSDRFLVQGQRGIEHHLLLNEFRVQLGQIQQVVPALNARFVSNMSQAAGQVPGCGRVAPANPWPAIGPGDQSAAMIPDGVFSITDTKGRKTVLFFLEVDMGTENLTSRRQTGSDVQQKIANYQACFRQQQYKVQYEQLWGCGLRGFRLLFLTHSAQRMAALCRLTLAMPPSDFIWTTDRQSIMTNGIWARIWARGGRDDAPLQSILGSQAPDPAPSPEDLTKALSPPGPAQGIASGS
jgi:hypothetical protein